MKITFILKTTSFAGGVRVVATYARRLSERGHEVCVISQPYARPTLRQRAKALLRGGRVRWPAISSDSYLDALAIEHRRLPRARAVTDADVPDADVVIATWWETAEWVSRLSPRKGAKAYFIQGWESFGGDERRVADTWRLPMHKIVISRWLGALAADRFGDRDHSLVPNSVDMEIFHAPPREKGNVPTVGMLYSSAWFKGCGDAFKALEQVRRALPSLRLIMFGKERPSTAVAPPAWSQLLFKPAQETLRDIYAQCDAWLCPSHMEGFHLPSLEAMACRCPVVATRCGGPEDIVEDGRNGHLVDVGDAQVMAKRLLEVLTLEPPAWRAMSDAAYARATRYTWDDATDLFEAGLNRAIEKNVQRAALA